MQGHHSPSSSEVRNPPVEAPVPLAPPLQRLRLGPARLPRLGVDVALELGLGVLEEGVLLRAARHVAGGLLLGLADEGLELGLLPLREAGRRGRAGRELGVCADERRGLQAQVEGAPREAEEGGHCGWFAGCSGVRLGSRALRW